MSRPSGEHAIVDVTAATAPRTAAKPAAALAAVRDFLDRHRVLAFCLALAVEGVLLARGARALEGYMHRVGPAHAPGGCPGCAARELPPLPADLGVEARGVPSR